MLTWDQSLPRTQSKAAKKQVLRNLYRRIQMHVRNLLGKIMDSRKPVQNLAQSIHSLLGFKAHLTAAWVNSVCSIIRNLPSEAAPASHLVAQRDFEEHSSVKNGADSNMDVIRIKNELVQLISFIKQLNAQRRQLLNEFLDLKGNIRVFCRIRPTLMQSAFTVVALNSSDLLLNVSACKSKHYTFDKVFQPNSSQDEVFSDIEPIIKSVVDGYNACIFAYGQTGSGKTFTMEGTPQSPGVVQRGIEALFKQATVSNQELIITFSMLEIYLGHLKDLLVPQSSRVYDSVPRSLSVQTDPKGGIEIENLKSIQVGDSEQALKLYRLGSQLRSTASTDLNETSSRSHCMIRIKVSSINAPERRQEVNKLWMVDLGGSERMLKTKAQGRRFEEGKAINLSLSALGDVVDALQRKKSHIPYRNSKLTLVTQDCLGEDSKTLMLVHVSSEEEDLSESVCSLNFATRARSVNLGKRESQEAGERKKAALISLQQKMEQIEEERRGISWKIKKINKTLEILTKKSDLPSMQVAGASQLFMEESKPAAKDTDKIRNVRKYPTLELPRFMQPTVCSTRKSGIELTFLEYISTAPARRRGRSIIHRANSVSFPLKRNAAYSSDCGTSRTSGAMDLNMNSNIENETEYSQGTSEGDIRTLDFQMNEKPSMFIAHQTVHQNHIPSVANISLKRNLVSRLTIHEGNFWVKEQTKKEALPLPGHEARSFEFPINYDETENKHEGHLNKWPSLESPKIFATNRSAVLCHSTGSEPRTQTQGSENGFPEIDIDRSTLNFPEVSNECDTASDLEERGESMPAIYNDIECSKNYTIEQKLHAHPSQCKTYAGDIDPFRDFLSMQAMGVQIPKEHSDTITKKCNSESMDASVQNLSKETAQSLHRSQTHGALFTDKLKRDKVNTPIAHSQVFPKGTGLLISIKLKIQMLYFCALMWLGYRNLGYEDDFFHSLTH